jgi:acyl carrier protein
VKEPTIESVIDDVRRYVIAEFAPGEDPRNLPDDLNLQESGVIDSVKMLTLVAYVEKTFGVEASPNEVANDFGTLRDIANLVISKRK